MFNLFGQNYNMFSCMNLGMPWYSWMRPCYVPIQSYYALPNNLFQFNNMFGMNYNQSPFGFNNNNNFYNIWQGAFQSRGNASLGASSDNSKVEEETSTTKTETSEKTEPKKTTTTQPSKAQKITPELQKQIIAGTYSGDKVVVNGITHYRYADCKQSDLVSVGKGYLHKDAAAAFKKMQADAKNKAGLNLTAYSPFRSKATQIGNFSNKMSTKHRTFEQNLKWSAPGGYSEHHTGYAVDINCVSDNFVNTKEYKWLLEHAHEYGFELSFPKNNAQGIGFEPWHWRFIGTEKAKQTFAAARAADPRFNK